MLVGTTVDPQAYDRLSTYPGTRMCRIFGYAGKAMPAWEPTRGDGRVAAVRALAPSAVIAAVFQDWPDDQTVKSRLAGWLDQVDAPCRLTWRHEADRKGEDPAVYRRRYYLLQQWVMDHPHGEHVTLVPTQTYQWTMASAPGKGGGDWSTYYTGIGTTGVDVYADSWLPRYPHPDRFLAPLWRYRDTIGRPIEFPEFGAARVGGDPTGQGRADWLHECATRMRAEGVTAVCYWDDLGTGGTDLRLSVDAETPETRVWRQVITENNAAELGAEPPPG